MAAPQASSRLEMLQARFQQKQLQEKEQKLLQLYDQQQQRAYQVAQRASAGSNASNHGSSAQHTLTRTTSNIHTASNSQGGKVRQMFDERRQTTVKGIDRSYPLEPLDNKLRKQTSNGVVPSKNNVSRQTVSVKRVARADVNSNINAGKPIVSYHEEITRDTFGPQGHKQEIFEHDYDGENHVTRLSNGNLRDGSQLEFDETLKNRVRNDLESEQFPEDLMIDVPDKLPKKTGAARKLTQAEARLERFKNSAAKNPGLKSTGNALGVAKKRTETTGPAKSNTRVTKSPSPDIALKKTESNPRASIRRSVPTSPSKSPDIIPRRATTDIRSQEARSTRRSGPGSSGDASTSKVSLGSVKGTDEVDAIMFRNDSSNGGFSENFHDQLKSKEKATIKKQTSEKQISSTTGRPPSSVSSISSASSMPGQTSGAKKGMASKAKLKAPPISSGRVASASMENLVPCKCCSRRFAPDRIKKHEEICAGTNQKKRKQFDSMKFRVRGTELEPFVKKGPHKKQPEKAKKLEVKSDWRRKHEDFINAIRSAKQVKAHLDAGGKLSDLPPPPPSDTSDYIQCPHCGRKFNQAAAERHIPKCVHMLHNKPAHSRAPQRLKR